MGSTRSEVLYRGNSIISLEILPGYPHPVIVKRPVKQTESRRTIRSLEREYEMTGSLDGVEGVLKVVAQQTIGHQPALILEYIDGATLQETIEKKTLDLRAKLEVAVELTRTLRIDAEIDSVRADGRAERVTMTTPSFSLHVSINSHSRQIRRRCRAPPDRSFQRCRGPRSRRSPLHLSTLTDHRLVISLPVSRYHRILSAVNLVQHQDLEFPSADS